VLLYIAAASPSDAGVFVAEREDNSPSMGKAKSMPKSLLHIIVCHYGMLSCIAGSTQTEWISKGYFEADECQRADAYKLWPKIFPKMLVYIFK
jgi:hypothetical protein